MSRGRNRIYVVGYEATDNIYISEELPSRGGRRFLLKCKICNKDKVVYSYQLSSGNWDVCEHDVL